MSLSRNELSNSLKGSISKYMADCDFETNSLANYLPSFSRFGFILQDRLSRFYVKMANLQIGITKLICGNCKLEKKHTLFHTMCILSTKFQLDLIKTV